MAGREIKERMYDLLNSLQESLNEKEQMILQTRLLSDEPQTLQDIAMQRRDGDRRAVRNGSAAIEVDLQASSSRGCIFGGRA